MEGLFSSIAQSNAIHDISILDSLEGNPCYSHLSENDGPPTTKDEILTALK
jgi:hypothetical protein